MPEGLLDPFVNHAQRGPDALADRAFQIGLSVMHAEERLPFDGVVHVEQRDVRWIAGEGPTPPGAVTDRHKARPAQITKTAPDDHGVGVNTCGDLIRGQLIPSLLSCKRHPSKSVNGDRESAVRCHALPFCNRHYYIYHRPSFAATGSVHARPVRLRVARKRDSS